MNYTTVQATAVQFTDGRIDDGSVHEPQRVYLGDDARTSTQARELAAALIATADEVETMTTAAAMSVPVGGDWLS